MRQAAELQAEESAAEESEGVSAAGGSKDDLGDPDSWDLVGTHDSAASTTVIGSMNALLQDDSSGSENEIFEDDSWESPYEEDVGPVSPLWQGLDRVAHGVGWMITIFLSKNIV